MAANDLARDRNGRSTEELRSIWRIGGILFICGGLTSLPSTLLLGSDAVPAVYALTATTVALGCLCLLAARRALSRRWLQRDHGWHCVRRARGRGGRAALRLLLRLGGGVHRRRRPAAIRVRLAHRFLSLAVLAPLAYDPADAHAAIRYALLATPGLIPVALVVRHFGHGLERRERTLFEFAEEAVLLTERVNGSGRGVEDAGEVSEPAAAATPSARLGDRRGRWRTPAWRPRARAIR